MSILIRRVVTLALTLVTLTLLAACGPSNNVRLIYNTNTSAVLPLPGSPSVAVVMFNDERTRQYIGERKDGSVFTASSTIADWFSRSLADELGRQQEGRALFRKPEFHTGAPVHPVRFRHRKPAVRHAQGPAGSGRQEDPEPDPLIPETPSIKTRGEENRFLSLFRFPL